MDGRALPSPTLPPQMGAQLGRDWLTSWPGGRSLGQGSEKSTGPRVRIQAV